jgi:hypothetical protein
VKPKRGTETKPYLRGRAGPGQVGRPSDSGGAKNAREMAGLTNAIREFFIET